MLMISKSFEINEDNINKRLDIFLTENLDGLSRGIVQKSILLEQVTVNNAGSNKDYKLKFGDFIEVNIAPQQNNEDEAQEIDLETVFENKNLYRNYPHRNLQKIHQSLYTKILL